MSLAASRSPRTGVLNALGDDADDSLLVGRTAAGELQLNAGAVKIKGGKATVSNTDLIVIDTGAGDDTVVVDLANGPLPDLQIGGGLGTDTLRLVGSSDSENIEARVIDGGLEIFRDLGNLSIDLTGIEQLAFRPGGGGDNVIVTDLGGTGVQRVHVDLAGADPAAGDGVRDIVQVDGGAAGETLTVSAGPGLAAVHGLPYAFSVARIESSDSLFVFGGDGNDQLDGRTLASGVFRLELGGGSGHDTLLGGQGDDLLSGRDGNDSAVGGAGDDTLFLGDDSDRADWTVGDGSDFVDGGFGDDTLRVQGSGAADRLQLSVNAGAAVLSHDAGAERITLDRLETVRIESLGGADTLVVDELAGTAVTRVELDLGVDTATDTVSLRGAVTGALVFTMSGGQLTVGGLAATVVIDHFVPGTDQLVVNDLVFGG